MPWYLIFLVVGILVEVMVLLVLFSLLTMAQQEDAHLEKLAEKAEKGGRFKQMSLGTGEVQASAPQEEICPSHGVAYRGS